MTAMTARKVARAWSVGAGLAVALALALVGGAARAAVPSTTASDAPHECRIAGLAHSVLCGEVRRPLDPDRPGGAAIGVDYVVVPALARQKLADPIFFLAGGPGQSAIDVAPQILPLFSRLNNRRDIVFVDQRGTGRSEALDCPESSDDDPLVASRVTTEVAALQRCRIALEARPTLRTPGALGFFTTSIAVQDLDAVRRVLGAERIDLVGISYGTRVALEYLRQFPDAVRRVVLDAVAPPDLSLPESAASDSQAALEAVFDACEHEAACHASFATLRADWTKLLASLPRSIRVADPLGGAPSTVLLDRDRMLAAVRGALYSPVAASALPVAIAAAAQGRYEPLIGLGSLLRAGHGARLALGMHFSVVCAEDMPRLGQAAVDAPAAVPGIDFGAGSMALYRRVCADWPRGAVPAAFHSIPATPVPTLLLSGGLDPATPPRHALRTAQALGPRARTVTVPNAAHGVLTLGCGADVLFRFIDAADDRVATDDLGAACLTRIPRPPAYLPVQPASASTGAMPR